MARPAEFVPGPGGSDEPGRKVNCFAWVAESVNFPEAYPRTNTLASCGVETTPPDAHDQPAAMSSLPSSGAAGGSSWYPWTNGVGSNSTPGGRLVPGSPSGSENPPPTEAP